ncbi:hypothetical protein Tco_0786118 [Tanacetum coccineum]
MKYDDEGPSLTVNHVLTREEISREELEKDLWERIVILNEPRPIIKTLNYRDRYKKVLDTILLDKLKLDGELELEEMEANEEMIREYKAIKEKDDPDVKCKYVTRNTGKGHKNEENTNSYETLPYHGFIGYPFDYRVTLGFGSIVGGLDHVNLVIRLPLEHGISRVLGKDDHSNLRVETNPVTASIT